MRKITKKTDELSNLTASLSTNIFIDKLINVVNFINDVSIIDSGKAIEMMEMLKSQIFKTLYVNILQLKKTGISSSLRDEIAEIINIISEHLSECNVNGIVFTVGNLRDFLNTVPIKEIETDTNDVS